MLGLYRQWPARARGEAYRNVPPQMLADGAVLDVAHLAAPVPLHAKCHLALLAVGRDVEHPDGLVGRVVVGHVVLQQPVRSEITPGKMG